MNFLKRNYEKILLLALFLIFSGVLAHLFHIVSSTSEVKASDLRIPQREADYVGAEKDDPNFNLNSVLPNRSEWMKPSARDVKNKDNFSDLAEMFKAARCGHCEKLIPILYFDGKHKCPLCERNLLAPKKEDSSGSGGAKKGQDSDRDGIPDLAEIELGLNPYDYRDAMLDLDSDGFVNLYEYLEGTDLKEAKNHPPYVVGLSFNRFERQPLKVVLKGVTIVPNREKKQWRIQLQTQSMLSGRRMVAPRDFFESIGRTIIVNNVRYKILDIIPEEVEREIDGKKEKITVCKVTMEDPKKRIITMAENEIVYDPDDRVFFDYVFEDRQMDGIIGSVIRLGNAQTGIENYRILNIDRKGPVITLGLLGKEVTEFTVGKKPAIPEKFIPANIKGEDGKKDGNGMMNPDNAIGNNPDGVGNPGNMPGQNQLGNSTFLPGVNSVR